MIPKLVSSVSYDFQDPVSSLVPLCSYGADRDWFVKQASYGLFNDVISELKPEKGKTVVHVIALGDEEKFGPNRNCDSFSREDNIKCHHTFKDIGHVFRHHKHHSPSLSVGEVLATGHNDEMGRVELILKLDDYKCNDEVEAVHNNMDVPLSMGSLQDYDVCSYCNHKAPTSRDHCDHVKDMLGQVLEGGQKIYMKNPNPKFFDISLVYKPADRVAYVLKKVAADGSERVRGGHELAADVGLTHWASPKLATMKRLATIYKRVPAIARGITRPKSVRANTIEQLKTKVAAHGVRQVLGNLTNQGVLLSPEDFSRVIGYSKVATQCDVDSQSSLDEIMSDGTEVEDLEVPTALDDLHLDDSVSEDLRECCSMDSEPAQVRALHISIVKPVTKTAGITDPAEAKGFADLYNLYKVAFAVHNHGYTSRFTNLAQTF